MWTLFKYIPVVCKWNGDASTYVFLAPFLILSCSDLPKDSFFVREVAGLNWNTGIGAKGFLAISNTRCGTEELWMEWYLQVLIPSVKLSNDYHRAKSVRIL